MLERDDIDAVVITAPSHLHAGLALACAAARKHFYLEKPIATNAADGQRVIAATAEAGLIAAVGFNRRLHPLYERAREVLAAGRIGRVRAVQTAFCEPVALDAMPPWKRHRATGGGVLLDLASHHIDQLRWLLSDEVSSISGSLGSELSEGDSALVRLTMRGGAEVGGFFSFRAGPADYLEFVGEKGVLRVDRHSGGLTLQLERRFGYGSRQVWVPPSPALASWRLRRLVRPADPSYRRSFRAFVDLLRGGPARTATLEDGLRSLEAVLAVEASCASS